MPCLGWPSGSAVTVLPINKWRPDRRPREIVGRNGIKFSAVLCAAPRLLPLPRCCGPPQAPSHPSNGGGPSTQERGPELNHLLFVCIHKVFHPLEMPSLEQPLNQTQSRPDRASPDKPQRKRRLDVNPSLILNTEGRSKRRRTPSPLPDVQPEVDPKDVERAKHLGLSLYSKIMALRDSR